MEPRDGTILDRVIEEGDTWNVTFNKKPEGNEGGSTCKSLGDDLSRKMEK